MDKDAAEDIGKSMAWMAAFARGLMRLKAGASSGAGCRLSSEECRALLDGFRLLKGK
jgi:hypothetical protein